MKTTYLHNPEFERPLERYKGCMQAMSSLAEATDTLESARSLCDDARKAGIGPGGADSAGGTKNPVPEFSEALRTVSTLVEEIEKNVETIKELESDIAKNRINFEQARNEEIWIASFRIFLLLMCLVLVIFVARQCSGG